MASETFATRAELRARLRARMGYSTDDAKNTQNIAQLNEFLREAAQTVRDRYEVKRLECESIISTGVGERYYDYPANSAPGDIRRVSYWDTDRQEYVALRRRLILANLDTQADVSGDGLTAREGTPQLYEERSQTDVDGNITPALEIWPLPDDIYELKIEYKAGGNQFTDDDTPSMVDSLCILLFAFAEWLDVLGKESRAEKQRMKAEKRLLEVMGSPRAGQVLQRGEADRTRLKYGVRSTYREPPNIDTRPSVMPS